LSNQKSLLGIDFEASRGSTGHIARRTEAATLSLLWASLFSFHLLWPEAKKLVIARQTKERKKKKENFQGFLRGMRPAGVFRPLVFVFPNGRRMAVIPRAM
jgi:hypothetical protein